MSSGGEDSPNNSLERLVNDIQARIDERTREEYSEKVIELFKNPVNMGYLDQPSGFARRRGPCGDTMEISLRVEGGAVSECVFMTDGCGGSIVSGSMVTQLALGKPVAEAMKIDSDDVLDALGGLPDSDVHCSVLAVDTLRKALESYLDGCDEEE